MTPGRSLPGNTSGRSIAPGRQHDLAARTCHSRSRGAPAGGAAQVIGDALGRARSCCAGSSRRPSCAAAASRSAGGERRDSVSASHCCAGCPSIVAARSSSSEPPSSACSSQSMTRAPAARPRRAPRRAPPVRRRRPARRSARSAARSDRVGVASARAETRRAPDRRLVPAVPRRPRPHERLVIERGRQQRRRAGR